MATPLADLDELILRCRDERARTLISEAVAGYKGGAFRSAIVATWVAVCFDFIEKLRELTLTGDAVAEKQLARLEKIRSTDDVSGALAFERELLKLARDQFEFISPIEFVDLQRLQVDRNRCAHPSLVDETSPYMPSAELVRAHIVSAVDHVLRHPPAQGKFALDRLLAQIDSEYFPTKKDVALEVLRAGPLLKARESLVRNLIIVLLKTCFSQSGLERMRKVTALKVIETLHPAPYRTTVREKLSSLIRAVPDESLRTTLHPLSEIPQAWSSLDADVTHRLSSYVKSLPSEDIEMLEWLVSSKLFAAEAISRLSRATRKELRDAIFFAVDGPIADRYIQLYLDSKSFDQANDWSREIAGNVSEFDEMQIRRLILEGAKNPEIHGSFRFPDVINAARKAKRLDDATFNELLVEAGLDEYVVELDSDIPF